MEVLVIPDVHLKPKLFRSAAKLMKNGVSEQAVCLMDLADDWDCQYDIQLYETTFDTAIQFVKEFPTTRFCWGNHDLSYRWHCLQSGYSTMASTAVQKKLLDLQEALTEDNPIRYIQKIDNVLFCHGGILDWFVKEYIFDEKYNDVDAVVSTINQFGKREMWNDASPIWARPQKVSSLLYKPTECLQVVGHTPVSEITRSGNLISCDVFSSNRGKKIGTEEFLLIDTETWAYRSIQC